MTSANGAVNRTCPVGLQHAARDHRPVTSGAGHGAGRTVVAGDGGGRDPGAYPGTGHDVTAGAQ